MSGPFIRMIVNVAVMSASVLSRAFVAAYQQALQSKCFGDGGRPGDERVCRVSIIHTVILTRHA